MSAYPMEGMLRALARRAPRRAASSSAKTSAPCRRGSASAWTAANVFSYRVLFFERDGTTFRPADTYPDKAVACVATHDLPTLKGWWDGLDLALDRTLGRAVSPTAKADRKADRASLAALVGASAAMLTARRWPARSTAISHPRRPPWSSRRPKTSRTRAIPSTSPAPSRNTPTGAAASTSRSRGCSRPTPRRRSWRRSGPRGGEAWAEINRAAE